MTVKSVYSQTVLPREIIMVDDCSIIPLASDMLPPPPPNLPVRIFRNDPNLGGAASLNRGSREATSPFVAFLDSDDCLLPDYCEKVARQWQTATPDVVCVTTGFFWCNDSLVPYKKQIVTTPITHATLLSQGNIAGGSSVMSVRRAPFLSVGGHPDIRGSHDWGMLIRISKVGKIISIAEPLVLYRSPSTNPRSTYTKSYRRQLLAVCSLYQLQPQPDRTLMRHLIMKSTIAKLAILGHRRKALRWHLYTLCKERKIDVDALKTFTIIILGRSLYDKVLFNYAELRAFLFGKRLLASRNIP